MPKKSIFETPSGPTCEVVGPCKVEVDGPAEQAEWDAEERADDDAPVLVVEQVLLVLFVLGVHRTGVVWLDDAIALGSDKGIRLRVESSVDFYHN